MTIWHGFASDEVEFALSADGVGTLTLNAPDRRNALTPGLVEDIVAVLDRVERSPDVRAMVLAANGPAFCAGASLAQLDVADDQTLRSIYRCFLRVRDLAIPTVAAVQGPAIGAGMNLALACDLRVTTPAALFDARFAAIGLHPGGGASWLLRHRANESLAIAMLIYGERISGSDAVQRGLAWTCVDEAELHDSARSIAARAAAVPSELARLIKSTIGQTRSMTHEEAIELELERQVWTTTQPWFAQQRATSRRG